MLLSVLLFLSSCSSPGFDAIPTIGYGRRLASNEGEYVTFGVSIVPTHAPTPVRVLRRREELYWPDPEPLLPLPPKEKLDEKPEENAKEDDDDVVITGSWGIVTISQELLKYLILPLLFGGAFVYKKRKAKIEEDEV